MRRSKDSSPDDPFKRLKGICFPAMPSGRIKNLSDYFAVINVYLREGTLAWFRGHARASWSLAPAALRPDSSAKRRRALELVDEFRRIVEPRIPSPPTGTESEVRFQWLQIAQHYGMPTRLLDWTTNAAIALYFACLDPEFDGAVLVLDPENLNATSKKGSRILNAVRDMNTISQYLNLPPQEASRGRGTIAIQPTWNNERIALQHGCFTLHGSRKFGLDKDQAPGLSHIPVFKDVKKNLQGELVRIGVAEMFIFPEPEHVSAQLIRDNGLCS